MKKIFAILMVTFLLTSCGVKIDDSGVSVDGGEQGSIEVGENGVSIDGGEQGSITIDESGVNMESTDLGNVELGEDGVVIDGENLEDTISEMTDISELLGE